MGNTISRYQSDLIDLTQQRVKQQDESGPLCLKHRAHEPTKILKFEMVNNLKKIYYFLLLLS